jgi:hypothetical protein
VYTRVVVSRNGEFFLALALFSLLSLFREFFKIFFVRQLLHKKKKCPSTNFLEKAPPRRRECSDESCPLLRRKRRRRRRRRERGRFVRFRGERWEEASFCLLLLLTIRRGGFGKESNQRRFPPPLSCSFAGTSARIGKFPWFCENRRNI